MQVTLNALPASLAEFRNLSLNTPDEVVAGFLCALNLYVKNPNEGVEAMNLLRGPRPMTPYDSQFLRDRLRGKEYLPLAYFAGATPQNSYVPTQPYVLNVLADPVRRTLNRAICGYLSPRPARTPPGLSSCGRSPPPANGSCGSIPALSAASASRPLRIPGLKTMKRRWIALALLLALAVSLTACQVEFVPHGSRRTTAAPR